MCLMMDFIAGNIPFPTINISILILISQIMQKDMAAFNIIVYFSNTWIGLKKKTTLNIMGVDIFYFTQILLIYIFVPFCLLQWLFPSKNLKYGIYGIPKSRHDDVFFLGQVERKLFG